MVSSRTETKFFQVAASKEVNDQGQWHESNRREAVAGETVLESRDCQLTFPRRLGFRPQEVSPEMRYR
jgi:hypothetical protein